MFALISTMGLVLVSWFFLFFLFSGLGLIGQTILKKQINSGTDSLDAFWIGWSASLLILQLWHFAFPVNDFIFIILSFISVSSLVAHRQQWIPIVRKLKQYPVFILIVTLMLLWFSSRALDMPTAYDTGFRDIQAVMWIDTYAIVPGLNNLFASLAFNHSGYLYNALLDVSIWSGRAYHIATGLLLVVFMSKSIWSAYQLFRYRHDGKRIQWSWIISTLLIPYILFETIRLGAITHFLTDTTVDIIGFFCIIYLIDFLQNYHIDNLKYDYLIWRLAILILTGFILKQSFIIFGLGLGVLVLIIWLMRGGWHAGVRRFFNIITPILILAVLLGVPYLARGVVTSGYIAYPQSFGRFEVDWAEPPELIEERQEMLATNTRLRYGNPDEVLSSWDWLKPWFSSLVKNLVDFLIPISITVLAFGIYAFNRFRNRGQHSRPLIDLWIFIPMLMMIAVWFLTAPNIKYIRYILWINAVVMVLLAVIWVQIAWKWRVYGVFAILSLCMLYFVYLVIATSTWTMIVKDNTGLQIRPQPPIKVLVTLSGLELNVPDSHINQCWDIPLPCTPFARTRIYERVPGELQHGFGLTPKQ